MLYQFTFAPNRSKSDISEALGPIHYITLKAFAMVQQKTRLFTDFFSAPFPYLQPRSRLKLVVQLLIGELTFKLESQNSWNVELIWSAAR